MTTFVFESMTAAQAANFTSADTLIFSTATLQPSDVSVLNSDNGLDLTYLTAGSKTLVFSGSALNNHIQFTSSFIAGHSDSLFLGSFNNDTAGHTISITSNDDGNIAYGFYGNDSIVGGSGADVIFGGGGSDTIDGGSGNDHIYGFQLSGGTSADDGADLIHGGNGNDYIQGNAGNDVLFGDAGNDRINGGADNDTIYGGTGNDTINGNKGDDLIHGDDGNDSLRGGAGNDVIFGDTGNDIILGDLGNDTIIGGAGYDIMTGGAGNDLFVFNAGDAPILTTGTLAYFTDVITDFTHGSDKLGLPSTIGQATADVLHAQDGITLTSLAAALTYAQQLLNAHSGTTDVAVLEVGSDAYLFYNDTGSGADINAVIKLAGVDASVINNTDIYVAPPPPLV